MMRKLSNYFRLILQLVLTSTLIPVEVVSAQTTHQVQKNSLQLPMNTFELNFVWLGDSINKKWEPNAAMLIPVKFYKCPKTFYMQFDLGAANSMFYSFKMESIIQKYPKAAPLIDTSFYMYNFNFSLDQTKIDVSKMKVKKYGGKTVDWNNKGNFEIVGTIGMDFIEGKIISIDYPNKKIQIGNTIPKLINEKMFTTEFTLMKNSILFPVVIKGKKTMLYFDSGSSAYELLCSKETCVSLADNTIAPEVQTVNSWGKNLTATSYVTKDSVEIGNQKIAIGHATYIDGASDNQIQRMLKLGIGGMTGNKLFMHSTLVIDTKNRKFGIIKTN